ncbi:uncharacterized protein BJ171DRAFT_510436 [Polychytrium aggregatum]|uniref:uncharacterized protein n=1 Tax=Polychytrium aggregatum TaxID=110093 RepID=UPI0022FE94D8|nr:uncharacterized protein BJ171DRAFT_510436 [Polychytrium aggregatum]KAI9203348.1 hypothetical protein BJ171DRAFT_510436 [Polychytrium aggregatum]
MNHFSPGGNRPYSSDVVIKPEQKNLVACALVNRHWSSQAIPIIWTIPQLTSLEMLEKFTMSCLCNYMEECYGKRRSSLTRYVRELYVTYHFDTHDRLTVKEQWSGLECVRMVSKFLPELRNASVDLGEGCLGPLTLQSLLSWCPKINQLSNVIAGVETVLAPMAVPGYFGNLKKLITLDLGGTKYGPMMKTETGSMFLKAVAHNVGVNLRGIDLSDSPLTSEILYELCGNCPNLQVIDINSVVGLSPECLAMVPRMCPNLVAYIIFPNTGLTTEHIEMLFQSAPYLRMIDIESDALDARRVFEAIKKYSPKLSTISLGSCKLQEERDIIELIQERGPKLMDLQMGTQTMTEEIFVALGRYCPNLYSLELHADFVPTGSISYGSGISFMASACPDLRHLSVQDHEGNEDLFQHVTKGYRNCNFLNPVLDATFLGYPRFDQPPVGLVGDESADRMDLG